MQLLTKTIRNSLPPLGGTDGQPADQIKVRVKFFDPQGSWSWYAVEFDGDDRFFGWVDGSFPELGYFSLHELSKFRGRFGLGIERDMYFTGRTLGDVMGLGS